LEWDRRADRETRGRAIPVLRLVRTTAQLVAIYNTRSKPICCRRQSQLNCCNSLITDYSNVITSLLTTAAVTLTSAVETHSVCIRDDHGNGIPNGNGNPMGFPWEWELVTKLGMGMGRNGKQLVWEWEWPLFPWESIPIGGYSYVIVQFIET